MKRFSVYFIAFVAMAVPMMAQRLPKTAVPSHYKLHFTPNLEAATFAGEETIDLTVAKPTTTISLNAVEIKFESVEVEQNEIGRAHV